MNREARSITSRAARLMEAPDRQGTRSMATKARDNANMALNARSDECARLFLADARIYLHDAQ
jgi:hypothetical protein